MSVQTTVQDVTPEGSMIERPGQPITDGIRIPGGLGDWIRGLPEWLQLVILGSAFLLIAVAAHRVIFAILSHATRHEGRSPTFRLVKRTSKPALAVMCTLALRLATEFRIVTAGESSAYVENLRHGLLVAFILSVTWLIIGIISGGDDMFLARYRIDVKDNLKARRMHTQVRVISRTLMIVVGIVGIGIALITFDQVEKIGASLLASAGIAGLVIGMAARPALGNIIAGIQIALTQPIRLDDVVIIEGEWGRIEEITTTYVVVKIWDERRLIVPFSHIIEKPFQNWTRTNADILGTVFIYTDYRMPVEALRGELERLVKETDLWDGRVCVLQVSDCTERTMQIRALVSAADSPTAWDLRVWLREKLIEYIQREHPECLPRTRIDLNEQETGKADGAERA